jgi:hypothetical protein
MNYRFTSRVVIQTPHSATWIITAETHSVGVEILKDVTGSTMKSEGDQSQTRFSMLYNAHLC